MTSAPLPARMRPRTLDEVVGHVELVRPGSDLRRAVADGRLQSLLLWGPPGCGKTTLARLLADASGMRFRNLSAVLDGMPALRDVIEEAKKPLLGQRMVLFVDEIHRWNKAQQDALLPHVEEGLLTLIGATTENPSFEIIPALRSRCRLIRLAALDDADIAAVIDQALADVERGLGGRYLLTQAARSLLVGLAAGDARRALLLLERACTGDVGTVDEERVRDIAGEVDLLHDKAGDAHFDVVSAFIKSLRGSDPDAALYWMARMLEGGEPPEFIARRMIIFASEDVGNAEPRALPLAVAAADAIERIGMPEGRIVLGQAATFLATAPKSDASYRAIGRALEVVRESGPLPVPNHLRNAPTALARSMGHGKDYQNPHRAPDHVVAQRYLPEGLNAGAFYEPTDQGAEKVIAERMKWWRERRR